MHVVTFIGEEFMRRMIVVGVALLAACTPDNAQPDLPVALAAAVNQNDEATLLARAILAADAYQPGPPSGTFITGDNGVTPPFPGQPIPGFSAILDAKDGTFLAMPD